MKARVNQLRQLLAEHNLDVLVISNPLNYRYLSGFTGSAGALCITADTQYIIADSRYYIQAEQQAPDWQLVKSQQGWQVGVLEWVKEHQAKRVGFEADHLTYKEWHKFATTSPEGTEWVAFSDVVIKMRSVKATHEYDGIRAAQALTDLAGERLPLMIQVGMTEKQVAWELEKFLRENGADALAFETIVASGPNSARPHHRPTNRVIEANEPVTIDFGAKLNGWHSDMTRTFFTGEPTLEYRRVYETVLGAVDVVERDLKAGTGLRAADSLARDYIVEFGYGDYFGHGLGHGVGLEIHEQPQLSFRAEENAITYSGQIVTIEPGIYIPDWGGVRIEDMAMVTPEGVEILTQTTKDIDAWRNARQTA
jgi:Xaa-Pro aminopeptidase